jgi:hypothetical protein
MSEQETSQKDQLAILHPDRQLVIGDPPREVTVREFRFIEGMRVHVIAKPIVEDLLRMFGTHELGVHQITDLFVRHEPEFMSMLCASTGLDDKFIRSLNDVDGELLLLTFWQVNLLFFLRRLLARQKELQQAKGVQAGATPPSSARYTPA